MKILGPGLQQKCTLFCSFRGHCPLKNTPISRFRGNLMSADRVEKTPLFHEIQSARAHTYTWHNKLIYQRFLKPAVHYPTTVNNSEIYILLPKGGGGSMMVPIIWFFGSRILTLQYFWLIILYIIAYINRSCASFGEKKKISCVVFELVPN